jgi:pyruvate/2-oxoglutarate dehydrogenase complex dihydrolipoamide acyltransferase (E2) component
MATSIYLPKMGMGMEEGSISEWLVADGERVEVGRALYVLESDKVETEIESQAAGTIRLIGEAGGTYPVGTLIAEIDES